MDSSIDLTTATESTINLKTNFISEFIPFKAGQAAVYGRIIYGRSIYGCSVASGAYLISSVMEMIMDLVSALQTGTISLASDMFPVISIPSPLIISVSLVSEFEVEE